MPEVNRTEYGDIVIGGINKFVHSTISVSCYESRSVSVSENSNHYWVHTNIDDFNLYIIKDSDESKKLEELMKENKPSEILRFANELILENLKSSELWKLILDIKHKEYHRGYTDAQKKMRNALGMEV